MFEDQKQPTMFRNEEVDKDMMDYGIAKNIAIKRV